MCSFPQNYTYKLIEVQGILPELKRRIPKPKPFQLHNLVAHLVAIRDLSIYMQKYLKGHPQYIYRHELELNVVVRFKLLGVLDKCLHDLEVLLLPDFCEGLVDHEQVEFFHFQLVDKVPL